MAETPAATPGIAQQLQKIDERTADVSKQITDVGDQKQASATAREGATAPLLNDVARLQGDAAQFIERRQAGRPVIPEFKPLQQMQKPTANQRATPAS